MPIQPRKTTVTVLCELAPRIAHMITFNKVAVGQQNLKSLQSDVTLTYGKSLEVNTMKKLGSYHCGDDFRFQRVSKRSVYNG